MPTQVFVCIDVETDGPIPGPNSMLSLGAVAFSADGRDCGEFYGTFAPLPLAKPDPDTLKWWSQFPDEFEEATRDTQPAYKAICDFVGWVRSLKGEAVLVADPATFDGMFVNWYCIAEGGYTYDELPWRHRVLDARTLRFAHVGGSYHDCHASRVAKAMGVQFEGRPHVAIDDARHLAKVTRPTLIEGKVTR